MKIKEGKTNFIRIVDLFTVSILLLVISFSLARSIGHFSLSNDEIEYIDLGLMLAMNAGLGTAFILIAITIFNGQEFGPKWRLPAFSLYIIGAIAATACMILDIMYIVQKTEGIPVNDAVELE